MVIKNVIRMGNQKLQGKAMPVSNFNTPELDRLIADLFDTMRATGGVGIAAPQIGVPLQVTVFGFQNSARYPHVNPVPDTVLINPQLEPLETEKYEDWEGCLSIRGIRGLVPRYTKIHYKGYDQHGNFFERTVTGFHARLVQHEVDHLNGTLFVERVKNLKCIGFEEELTDIIKATRANFEQKYL